MKKGINFSTLYLFAKNWEIKTSSFSTQENQAIARREVFFEPVVISTDPLKTIPQSGAVLIIPKLCLD
jgi:hypothetical protein